MDVKRRIHIVVPAIAIVVLQFIHIHLGTYDHLLFHQSNKPCHAHTVLQNTIRCDCSRSPVTDLTTHLFEEK